MATKINNPESKEDNHEGSRKRSGVSGPQRVYGPISLAETNNPPPIDLPFVLLYANAIEGRTVGAEIAPSWEISP